MGDIIQVLVSGIAMGGVYTLLGNGMFITYRTTQALNFGQGDLLALAAYLTLAFAAWGLPVVVLIPLTILAVASLGIVVERVAVRPFQDRKQAGGGLAWILTTFGVGLLIQNTIVVIWGKSKQYAPPLFSTPDNNLLTIAGIRFYREELAVALASLVIAAIFYWALYRTRWGKCVAVVSFDKSTASLLGVNVRRTVVTSYMLMAALTAVSGALLGPLTTVDAHMGMLFLIKGFAVVSLGGFTNPLGVLFGGLAFGTVEAFANYLDSNFGDLYPYLFVFAALVIRPSGMFGEHGMKVR